MIREQAAEFLPIIKAFAEGKTIQVLTYDNKWEDIDEPLFNVPPSNYRIKSEPKYRPFNNIEECWEEIQKHQPIGWIKTKIGIQKYCISEISENYDWEYRFKTYTFADGTPYGIKS